MTQRPRCQLLAAAWALVPSVAPAQLGELHLGALVSYGVENPYGPGGGLVVGVAPGRLSYLGLRWASYGGSTESAGAATTAVAVTSRVQVFAVDLGVQIPAGAFEIVPGASLGVVRFAQRARQLAGPQSTTGEHTTEFLAAPGVAVQVRLARLLVIPELQYFLAGDPDLEWPVPQRGPVATLRVVVPLEIGRIRH